MIIAGIDPGLTGAIAIIDTDKLSSFIGDLPIVDGRINCHSLLTNLVIVCNDGTRRHPDHVFIERAGPMPKQGVASTCKFCMCYGMILACVMAAKIPVTEVAPSVWKRHYKLSRDKEQSRALALKLYPMDGEKFARKKDHNRAEALLLAAYGVKQCLHGLK